MPSAPNCARHAASAACRHWRAPSCGGLRRPSPSAWRSRRTARAGSIATAPGDHLAGRAVDRDHVALLARPRPPVIERAGPVVDAQRRPHPTTQGLPMPRATTAAWLVMPPRAVRMPSAACMPWMSSGLVSTRTRITLLALCLGASRLPRGRRRHARRRARRGRQAGGDQLARGRGIDGRVEELVERLPDRCARPLPPGDQPFLGHVDGDPHRRLPVRLPVRVCSMHSLPRSMVNSRSCMSR